MLAKYFDNKGKEIDSKIELRDDVFNVKVNKKLLTQAVLTYLANQRQSNANTKDRGEVSGGGKKPWRQKGTGRARAGSSRSPIWKGGGVTFGPTNAINYKKKLTKKMKKLAMISSFSLQAQSDNVIVYKDIELKNGKTSELLKVLGELKDKKVLLIQKDNTSNLFNASTNLQNINIEVINSVNYYQILNAGVIVIIESALENLYKFWGDKVKSELIKKTVKKEDVKSTKKKVIKKGVKDIKK